MKRIILYIFLSVLSIASFAQGAWDRWENTTGTNAYTLSVLTPTYPATHSKTQVYVKFGNTNSSTVTFRVNSIAFDPVRYWDGDSWEVLSASGAIDVNTIYRLTHNTPGGYWELEPFSVSGGSSGVTSVATTSPITGGTITTTGTIGIDNAAADGSTKGAASFVANDFNATSGNIGIDYTNGQAASGSVKGFLTSTDWTTFNSKVSSLKTMNNLPPSVHASSFTLNPGDTSVMHIITGGSGAIEITFGAFSGLTGKGLQFAFRRQRADTVYFNDGSETLIPGPGGDLGITDSTFAYLYYNGTTDIFYLSGGSSGGGGIGGGSGTVTDVSVVTANGISGSVATSTTTPAITLSLGAITPTSVNSVVLSGASTPTLAVTGTVTVAGTHSGTSSGTNTGDQTSVTGNAGTATALATSRTIGTLTGDATSAGSSFNGTANNTNAVTLATVNSNVGSFGSSTSISAFTVNAKGLITAASSSSIAALTFNRQTSDYTLVLTDADKKCVETNQAIANTVTVPLNSSVAFPIGTTIEVSQYGAGLTSIVATGGVTIRTLTNLNLPGQYGAVGLEKVGTDEWYLRNGRLPTGAAVTRVNGTNVTATLTGTPEFGAASAWGFTLGWQGLLGVAEGGTATDNTTINYTPTLFNTANISSSTAIQLGITKIGNTVYVFGQVTIDPTTTLTLTTLGMSLPYASNFTTANQAGGTIGCDVVGNSGRIFSDATNDRVTLQFTATDVTSQTYGFNFMYQVL